MSGLQKNKKDIVLSLYRDDRTVFRLIDVSMLVEEISMSSLSKKLNYYVATGQLQNPRKGIYAKQNFNPEELACCLYSPAYISLDYVLQRSGIIFQYNTQITTVSYLSRIVDLENQSFRFRKIKNTILTNLTGIKRLDNSVNIATQERAFLDMLYLEPDYYFDNLNPLDKTLTMKFLQIYQSKTLSKRINKLLNNV